MNRLNHLWSLVSHKKIAHELGASYGLQSQGEHAWLAQRHAPWLDIVLKRPALKGMWVLIRVRLFRRGTNCVARVRMDTGNGFDGSQVVELPATRRGIIEEVVYLPPGSRALRWEPVQAQGHFEQSPVRLVRINALEAHVRRWARVVFMMHTRTPRQLAKSGISWRHALLDIDNTYRAAGRLRNRTPQLSYREWVEQFDILSAVDRRDIHRHLATLPTRPMISVLMPVFNTPIPLLRRAIDSVMNQLYQDWELCIADDASTDPEVRRVLDVYAATDARIRLVYRESNGHISAASNSALAVARGEYVALLDHDDMLTEHALYLVALEIISHPGAVLIYSDEDKIDAFGQRFDPYFKPDWNPQLLLGQNVINHLGVYRTDRVRELGGFRRGFEGAQDYDLALRVTEQAPLGAIRHIPAVLYHWGVTAGSMASSVLEKPYALQAARKAIEAHLQRRGVDAEVMRLGKSAFHRVRYNTSPPQPMVSIIVPTRDAFETLRRCINSVLRKTTYPNYEIVVVDNQTHEPRACRYLKRLAAIANVRVMAYDRPFNYSAINNLAAGEARGEVICLLNNDTQVITPDWLQDMLGHLQQDRVGVVGAKLLYPDGAIQHAGILLHPRNIAVHAHAGVFKRESGYFGRAMLAQDFTAVTGACLMVWKRIYEEIGGLEALHLPIAFNDVDFCLRVRQAGYRVVWTPYTQLYHHEAFSRGTVDTAVKQKHFKRERQYMRKRWGSALQADPFYNPNLSLERPEFALSDAPRYQKPWLTQVPVAPSSRT